MDLKDLENPIKISLGDGHKLNATKIGNINVGCTLDDGTTSKFILKDVLYVPDLSFNLMSVSKSSKMGAKFEFSSDTCLVKFCDKLVATGLKIGDLYYLKTIGESSYISKLLQRRRVQCLVEKGQEGIEPHARNKRRNVTLFSY